MSTVTETTHPNIIDIKTGKPKITIHIKKRKGESVTLKMKYNKETGRIEVDPTSIG